MQYNKLIDIDWEKILKKDRSEMDPYIFWATVFVQENAAGKQIFKELALFAITALCLETLYTKLKKKFHFDL